MVGLSDGIVNKRVPKNRFKAELVGVDVITWLYKISADTADFRHGDTIVEIQVFRVVFKGDQIIKRELAAIQKEIPYPILFIAHGKSYFMVEGELLESDKQFIDGDALTIERRSAKLTELYDDIASAFVAIAPKVDENIAELAVRYKQLRAIERALDVLQRKVDAEKQPNKRIELNEELKRLKAEKEQLL